jgi:hypothetical protein
MIRESFDSMLVAAYVDFDVPVDRFFADDRLRGDFVASLAKRIGDQKLDAASIMRRLMNLRKKGRLPRLRRAYHGRNAR